MVLLLCTVVLVYFLKPLTILTHANQAEPTITIVPFEVISLTPSTPTPFQPLPTDTPTPTPTLTPTETPTNTPQPTDTPVPTNTPYPTNPPVPTQVIWPTEVYIAPTQAPSEGGASTSVHLAVSGSYQTHSLSCESRCAVDWANYFGVSISENSFLYGLPVSDEPDSGFVGDPDGVPGQLPPGPYGVHADPVASLLRQYGLAASAVHGYSMDGIRSQIDAGKPVIVWVYNGVWTGCSPISFTASNGHTSTVIRYEHTVIVKGYDSYYIYIQDGGSSYGVAISQFKSSWSCLGNMAVIAQ